MNDPRCESLNPTAYDLNQTELQCELAAGHFSTMHCYSGSAVPVYWPWSGWEAVAAGELLALGGSDE